MKILKYLKKCTYIWTYWYNWYIFTYWYLVSHYQSFLWNKRLILSFWKLISVCVSLIMFQIWNLALGWVWLWQIHIPTIVFCFLLVFFAPVQKVCGVKVRFQKLNFLSKIILKLRLFIIVDLRTRIGKASKVDTDKILSCSCWLSTKGSPSKGVFLSIWNRATDMCFIPHTPHTNSRDWSAFCGP